MKCYRLGMDCSSLLNDMARTCTNYNRDGFTQQLSTLPRIISGHLYMRTQHWLLMPADQELGKLPQHCFISLCRHVITWSETPNLKKIVELIWCKMSHYKDPTLCSDCTQVAQYGECSTEYQVDCKTMQKGQIALVFTVWQDFGSGMTPFDPVWQRHRSMFGLAVRSPSIRAGSLKEAFEAFRFDEDLMPEAKKALEITSTTGNCNVDPCGSTCGR